MYPHLPSCFMIMFNSRLPSYDEWNHFSSPIAYMHPCYYSSIPNRIRIPLAHQSERKIATYSLLSLLLMATPIELLNNLEVCKYVYVFHWDYSHTSWPTIAFTLKWPCMSLGPLIDVQEDPSEDPLPQTWTQNWPLHTNKHELHGIYMGTHILISCICMFVAYHSFQNSQNDYHGWGSL